MEKKSKADIARENGAKSRGPKTEEGKARSSRNALKSGEHATKLELFVPPHSATLCNEERREYAALVDELLDIYQPVNAVAVSIVKGIAIARWEIARLRGCITSHWNLHLANTANNACPVVPELAEIYCMAKASAELYPATGAVDRLSRQIDRLELRIARLERRLKFVHTNFPNPGNRTHPESQPNIANTELTPEPAPKNDEDEQTIYITENTPSVIAFYKSEFPGRKIVVLAPDDVAKGIDIDDDMPVAPRKPS